MADFEALPVGSRPAMNLALEALEFMSDQWGFTNKASRPERWQAIEALRAALARPEGVAQNLNSRRDAALLLETRRQEIGQELAAGQAQTGREQETSITTAEVRSCLTCAHILKGMLDAPCVSCMEASHWQQPASVTGAVLRWFGMHRTAGSK
jgi:hypothetical protein